MRLPIYVKNCIARLESAGFSAYAVGGAVRDGLLGLEPSDWDVTTSATPDEILSVFQNDRTIPTGIKHGTVTVLFENGGDLYPIEITTFRIDGKYNDARHPESVSFSKNVRDDLSRRDFTINAMAYNEKEGIIDAFEGMKDLERGVIRTVGDAKQRFSEDALRILRAFRFSAQLGFEIEESTFEGAIFCSHLLKNVARERIGVEFKKLLVSKGVVYALTKMIRGGVFEAVFEIPVPSTSLVDGLSRLECNNAFARMSVLLSDESEEKINGFLDSLRLSNAEKKLVQRLISIKCFDTEGQKLDFVARRFLHLYGDVFDPAVHLFKYYFADKPELFAVIESEREKKRALTIRSLAVRGNDLLPLCKSDHKMVGLLLNELLERVIEEPTLNEKEKLILLAEKLIEEKEKRT